MKVQWTRPAADDLRSIKRFIERDSKFYARRFVERLLDATRVLERFPLSGRLVPEAERDDIRELIFESYRIVYRVETLRVRIIAVVHASRDLTVPNPPWEVR